MRPALSLLFIAALSAGCGPVDRTINEPSPALQDIVDGHNAFAVDLYQQTVDNDENLFISPFSVSAALGMTYAGAAGETAAQMEEALQIRAQSGDYHDEFGALIRDLDGDKRRGYTLNIANRVYGSERIGWKPSFQQTLSADYGSPLLTVDFAGDGSAIRREINGWVQDETQGRIRDFLPEGFVRPSTSMILVNAIYFNGDWLHGFDQDRTVPAPFSGVEGMFDVPTMNRTADFPTATVDGARLVELPYEGDEVSMVIVLPEAVDGLAELEATLSSERLDGWIDQLREGGPVFVSLPKFEVESKLGLMDHLMALGMNDAFDVAAADFSAMSDARFAIDGVLHQTFVAVDEEGTEAAAATAVRASPVSDVVSERVAVDHPFLYAVRDKLTGSILFMGRVTDPR